MNLSKSTQASWLKLRTFCIGTLGILLAVGCASSPSHSQGIVLRESASGQTLDLRKDETFQILLDSNPSTGYAWEVAQIALDVLEQPGEPHFTPDSNFPGSGGTTRFTFRTIATGQTILRLIYHRPWEEDTPPLKTFEITLIITP